MRKWIEEASLCGGSGITILLETHGKALADFGIAREEVEKNLAWNLCYAGTGDGGHSHGTAITEQVKPTGKVISSLAVSNDTLICLVASCACCGAACHFDEPFEQNVH